MNLTDQLPQQISPFRIDSVRASLFSRSSLGEFEDLILVILSQAGRCENFETQDAFFSWLSKTEPLVHAAPMEKFPGEASIYILAKSDGSAQEFLLEYLTKWLFPTKKVAILSFRSCPFSFLETADQEYCIYEVKLVVDDQAGYNALTAGMKELAALLKTPQHA